MAVEPQASARRRQMFGLLIGLLVAGGSGVGLYLVVSKNNGTSAPTNLVSVVVASDQIAKGTKLADTNLTVVQRPQDQIPQPPTITYPDATALTTTDHFASVGIGKGQILTGDLIITTAVSTALTLPPLDLKDNTVAMAIPVDDQKGVGGWIVQGDHIDIIADVTGSGTVRYTLQDIPILRIGSTSQQGAGGVASLLVVALTRREAEELAFILNSRGTPAVVVRYVLRPKTQYGKSPTDHVECLAPAPAPPTPAHVCGFLPAADPTGTQAPPAEQPLNPQSWQTLFPPG